MHAVKISDGNNTGPKIAGDLGNPAKEGNNSQLTSCTPQLNRNAQPIMRQPNSLRQRLVRCLVPQLVRNMREPGLTRTNALRPFHGLIERQMIRMRLMPQGREYQHVQIC